MISPARLGRRTLLAALALAMLGGVSACGESGGDAPDKGADTRAPDRPQGDATRTSSAERRQSRQKAADTETRAQAQKGAGGPRQGGADGARSGGARTKRSERSKKAAPRVALRGDHGEARAALGTVDGAYENLERAIRGGVAAVDVAVAGTLEAAEGNSALTNVCQLMSEEAKRQAIDYAQRGAGLSDVSWTCEKATGLMLRRTRQHGALQLTLNAEVVGVNTDGDRATATVRFGDTKRPLSTIPLVKQDGQWKLGASLDTQE